MRLDHLLSKESHRLVRLVHAPVEGCVSLLSLIPRLIKRSLHVCVVSVGVAGWNTSTAQFQALLVDAMSVVEAGGELAHCWVLRGHPVGCCSRYRFWPGRPNARGFRVVVAWGLGCGCVLSVA